MGYGHVVSRMSSGILKGGEGGGFNPPEILKFDKAEPNSQFHGKYIHNNIIRVQVSLICKLSRTPD
jgi:hypothetical protein